MEMKKTIQTNMAVAPQTGCWIWQRSTDRHGYGRLRVGKKIKLAHRVSYESFVGDIPSHLTVDHLCRTRRCVNPKHMELVTNRENILRGNGLAAINAKKTHCIYGHKFTNENTYMNGTKRQCRRCIAAATNRYRDKRAAK